MLVTNIYGMTSNKLPTRERLLRSALDLFTRNGYEQTTVAEIAAAAGVSQMTFFRYFPSKQAVVVGDPYDPLIGEAVANQPYHLPPMERARRGLLSVLGQIREPLDAVTRVQIRLVAGHPTLRARTWENNRATEDAITAALQVDGVSALAARVAAAVCLAAATTAVLDWGADDGGDPLVERIAFALGQLSPGGIE